MAPLITRLFDDGPNHPLFYWTTGALSAFLDNAPTYVVFFGFAGGDPAQLSGPLSRVLVAISSGAVFFGAVHDYTSLFASVRERGKSMAEIAGKTLGKP